VPLRPTNARRRLRLRHCADDLARALGDVPWLTEELEVTISRQKGVDYRSVGGSRAARRPASAPRRSSGVPVRLGPTSRPYSSPGAFSATLSASGTRRRPRPARRRPRLDVALPALAGRRAHAHEIGPDAVDEITSAVAHCHRLIDSRPDRWYAGPCNAETDGRECGVDLYAKSAKGDVKCEACAAVYDVAARRSWLLAAAEDRLADAATLARSVSWLGASPLNAARVWKWAERGRIVAKGHDGTRPLYRIGDAIDLLAKEAG
jgi:hypothetical protein